MGELTIRLQRGTGPGAATVRAWTRSAYGHVDVTWRVGLNSMGFGLDVRPSVGVRLCYEVEMPDADSTQRQILLPDWLLQNTAKRFMSEDGAPYDWQGAVAAGIPALAREHPIGWFCSEAVWTVLADCGLATRLPAWRRTPQDVADLVESLTG